MPNKARRAVVIFCKYTDDTSKGTDVVGIPWYPLLGKTNRLSVGEVRYGVRESFHPRFSREETPFPCLADLESVDNASGYHPGRTKEMRVKSTVVLPQAR